MKIKYNKGFTLIELLTIIILLGIIALIAVPITLNVTEDAKLNVIKRDMNVIIRKVDEYCTIERAKNRTKCNGEFKDDDLKDVLDLGNYTLGTDLMVAIDETGNVGLAYNYEGEKCFYKGYSDSQLDVIDMEENNTCTLAENDTLEEEEP